MSAPIFTYAIWHEYPVLVAVSVAVLGLIIGSFLNVLILRLPVMMENAWRRECNAMLNPAAAPETVPDDTFNLVFPPSTCPKCGHRIKPWENIPLLSYALLRGRCAKCHASISIRYPAVEAATAVISLVVLWRFGLDARFAPALLLSWGLIALTVIDLDQQLLPDSITLPLLWAGLILNAWTLFVPLEAALWGAVIGYLSLWSVYWLFRLLTGKEGMGYGDFKLLAALGAWLGWQSVPLVIVLSSFVGALAGVVLIVFKKQDRGTPIPFGPYLAAAGWIALLWGDRLIQTYADYMVLP